MLRYRYREVGQFSKCILLVVALLAATTPVVSEEIPIPIRPSSSSEDYYQVKGQLNSDPGTVTDDLINQLPLSTNGKPCLSECRKSGKPYNWCHLIQEEPHKWWSYWDYCTPQESQTLTFESIAMDGILSAHGIPCSSKCSRGGNTKYFWCKTLKRWKSNKVSAKHEWDYCSPLPGFDSHMNKCSSPCDYDGRCFKWCYHGEGGTGWGYCSKA